MVGRWDFFLGLPIFRGELLVSERVYGNLGKCGRFSISTGDGISSLMEGLKSCLGRVTGSRDEYSINRQVQFNCKGCESKTAPCDCASRKLTATNFHQTNGNGKRWPCWSFSHMKKIWIASWCQPGPRCTICFDGQQYQGWSAKGVARWRFNLWEGYYEYLYVI